MQQMAEKHTPLKKGDRVTITAPSHPHTGEQGTVNGDRMPTGQYGLELTDCQHGTNECAVDPSDVKVLSKPPAEQGSAAGQGDKPVEQKVVDGRPTIYTPELGDEICAQIADGSSLRSVCLEKDKPDKSTVYRWLRLHEDFRDNYARACEDRADAMAEDILDIADDGSNDYMTITKGDQEYEVVNGEAIQRSKLRVDARKWHMSKMKPKKYGDKLDVSGETTVNHKFKDLDDEQLDAAIEARKNRAA